MQITGGYIMFDIIVKQIATVEEFDETLKNPGNG